MTPTISVRDADGQPLAGDAANLTLYVVTDGVSVEYVGAITETDAGEYIVTVDRDGMLQRVTGTSSTSGAIVVPSSWDNRFQNSPLPTPSSSSSYALWDNATDENGMLFEDAALSVKVVRISPEGLVDPDGSTSVSLLGKTVPCDENGQWVINIPIWMFKQAAVLVLQKSWAAADGQPVVQKWEAVLVAPETGDQVNWSSLRPRQV
jgi:hypothetical protein